MISPKNITAVAPRPIPLTKRAFDVATSAMGIICFAPVMAIVAGALAVRMGRPVLFTQERVGLDERTFTLYKFRTMTDARDRSGRLLSDSERLTPLGRLLRKTSLDELPQLWNVLKGDMSLVGPRPLLVRYLPYYSERERLRHTVRPGITGLAQISGRNRLGWDQRLELDVVYVESWTFWRDIQLLLKTLEQVVRRDGVIDAPGTALGTLVAERQSKGVSR